MLSSVDVNNPIYNRPTKSNSWMAGETTCPLYDHAGSPRGDQVVLFHYCDTGSEIEVTSISAGESHPDDANDAIIEKFTKKVRFI